MVPILLLAAALSATPDSLYYRATIRPESAIFEFPVHYDTAWAVGNTATPSRTPAFEWTVSTVARDTVFSFGYLLHGETPTTTVKFVDARSSFGERRLYANGAVDETVAVDVAFEATRVIIRLNDAATIRRIFGKHPALVQFSTRLAGGHRETMDVPVDYGEQVVAYVVVPPLVQQPDEPPDSTYLHLAMDFPVEGTFAYDVVSPTRVVNTYNEIRDVEVKGCMLSFQVWSQRAGQRFFTRTFTIPLDAIDPKSLIVRAQHPGRSSRYDPQPWLLQIALKHDSKTRIMTGDIEVPHKLATYDMYLDVKDRQTGELIGGWLIDAGSRCASWKTTPMKPIR